LYFFLLYFFYFFFFSSRRRHTRSKRDWSSDVCSSDLVSSSTIKVLSCQWAGQNKGDSNILFTLELLNQFQGHLNKHPLSHVVIRSEERRVGKECRTMM